MNVQHIIITIVFTLIGVFGSDAGQRFARDTRMTDSARKCLACHTGKKIVKTFENGESLDAVVNFEKYQTSVHSHLSCSECHPDFVSDEHPQRRFRSLQQYRIKSSRVCRKCHMDEQMKAKPIHAHLFDKETQGMSPICTDCHRAHEIQPTMGGRVYTNEKQYCQGCHDKEIRMDFRDGESMPLLMDHSKLTESVHNKLSCSDCHYGFSSEEHPERNFKTRRDYTIASSETCKRCHFDKYTKTLESIHFAMLSQGNLKAPVCTDCHGSHDVSYVIHERAFNAKRCQKCHSEIYDIYAKSIHGTALFNELNQDVPVCIDCHKAHDIRNPLTLEYHEMIPEMCSNCHANKKIVGKYGLSTDVVKTYLTDFHGVTLSLYRKQREALSKPARPIAVCTDCHGIHDISSTTGTDAAVVKANLVKRCQKCHTDVTNEFPDAWLSHYEPSLSRTPLVFIVNMGYKIFLPILMIGLFLQILLHIWRYAVNR
jgi:hypothetical protein